MRSRLERAIDRLDDAEEEHRKWGYALTPSERRAAWRRIQKLRLKVERLRGRGDRG